jgi:hypothetical protein
MLAASKKEQATLELANQAKRAAAAVEAQEAALVELVATREAEVVARLQELQKREEAMEEELAAGTRRLQERKRSSGRGRPRWRSSWRSRAPASIGSQVGSAR